MNLEQLKNANNQIIVTEEFKKKLKDINAFHTKNATPFLDYCRELRKLFNIEKIKMNENYQKFLGGFILGEGSLNASLKKKLDLRLGVALDLEFSVTQSIFGVSHLINLMDLFHTGRFEFKSGSNATFVFKISNRRSIFEKVFPFWKTFIAPFQTSFEKRRFEDFEKFENLFEKGAHLDRDLFVTTMLPLWDRLRKQKGQSNESFPSLQDAIDFVRANTR